MKKNLARREKKRKKRNVRTDEDIVTGREKGKRGKGERRTSILVESLYNDSRQALVGLEVACSTGEWLTVGSREPQRLPILSPPDTNGFTTDEWKKTVPRG